MFYPHREDDELTDQLFQTPDSAYRGAPFWAWNCRLDGEELRAQVHHFKEMGMGGFHVHCRTGLDTEYLGEEFFHCVDVVDEAAEMEGMRLYLYDEDRWPSGFAGGLVTRDKKYRTRFLVFSPTDYEEEVSLSYMAAAKAVRSDDRKELARYSVALDTDGYLQSYEKVDSHAKGNNIWKAHLEISGDTPWFNNQAYVNTLSPEAIQRFLEVTHEKYYDRYGKEFGRHIPTIFTDEPQTTLTGMLSEPFAREQIFIPYTDDFDETFQMTYGYSLLDKLPELFWESRDRDQKVRYDFHAHVVDRFSIAYGDQIGGWCNKHHIELTGHMLNEWTLLSQTKAVGDVMRPMMKFGIPGVDMLCDRRELSTVKQAVSVARQMGREGAMSEEYGVNGWNYDFRQHLLEGNWQAALGITFRVLHLTWASMAGEAKRDYPASIGYQAPWYKEYKIIEDHFARLNTAITRGKAEVSIAVVHPIETYWLKWGNNKQTGLVRESMDKRFKELIEWLTFNLLDFDFISEAMLDTEEISSVRNADHCFTVGQMNYKVVIVPGCETLRSATFVRLKDFYQRGGKIIFMGRKPTMLDAVINEEVKELVSKCEQIEYDEPELLRELEQFRVIDVDEQPVDGVDATRMVFQEGSTRSKNMAYQLRQDGSTKWLLLSQVYNPKNLDIVQTKKEKIRIRGNYRPTWYNTSNGDIIPLAATVDEGWTNILFYGSADSTLLVRLEPGDSTAYEGYRFSWHKAKATKRLPEPQQYVLSEPNAVILDLAEYAFDDESWHEEEEVLRIDNFFRERCGYPLRMEALAQPWVVQKSQAAQHVLRLRYHIKAERVINGIKLALENPENCIIVWNGERVSARTSGWYTDKHIRTIDLASTLKGLNILEITMPFNQKTNVEACYLLGNFGVTVQGTEKVLTDLPEKLYYGDVTRQKLPFYGGNITYTTNVETLDGELHMEISAYRGALIRVWIDGHDCGTLFAAPYRINCGKVSAGSHEIKCLLYGTRENTFGALHHFDSTERWYGPNLWRTEGNKWSYEYQVTKYGILKAPEIWIE